MIVPATNMAEGVSDWPSGAKSKFHLGVTDPDVQALKDYVRDK